MRRTMNRRRFLRVAAASASCGAAALASPLALADPAPVKWRGLAMGTLASIEIRHSDATQANRIVEAATNEIARLESVMSLYRADSALSTLNRDRILRDPPLDFVRVLSEAHRFATLTGGVFDVTVQPLWMVYADHFAKPGNDPAGPKPDLIKRAAERVDFRALEIEPTVVGLRGPGMQVTLNGIAQGYITDRIVELLRNEGLDHVLVDLGEIRALGGRDSRQPWQAGIEDPLNRKALLADVPLLDNALATSGGYGFRFDSAGRFHHIFDPTTGSCPHRYASVSVVAPNATTADALATAGNLMPPQVLAVALKAAVAERALLIDSGGAPHWITS